MLYNFTEWKKQDGINESNSVDKIVNWLSSNFGGTISKIDSLISDILKIEEDYMKEWNEIQTDIDSLEVQKAQIKSDPAEAKKLERLIDRNQKLLNTLSKKRRSQIESIEKKVEDTVKDKQRLIKYWNYKKAQAEVDVAERLYKLAKNLTDQSIADELYDKYKDAALMARKKDEDFRKTYGKLDFSKDSTVDTETTGEEKAISSAKFSMDPILAMNAVQFTKYVQGMEKAQVRDLIKTMMTERNERYATLDTERDRLEAQASSKNLSKSEINKSLKDFRENLMEQIRDLRTKITIARRYA
jgi:uncharacterized small protein (DUF1192 family)